MTSYEVVEKLWNQAKFSVLVARIPKEIINDKLAVLSDGSGTITYGRYDRFLLNTCLVDPTKVWSFLDTLEPDPETFLEAAMGLRNLILEVNPLLNPELLIINSENIIKLPEVDHTPSNSRSLTQNPDWEKPEFIEPDVDDIEDFIMRLPPPPYPMDMSGVNENSDNLVIETSKILEGMPITVVVYEQTDITEIFKNKYVFNNEESAYKLFIVSKCVLDFRNLFLVIDRLGYSRKNKPEEIVDDLYGLCIKHNPFLSWDTIDLEKVKKAVVDRFGKKSRPREDFSKTPPKRAEGFTDRPSTEESVEYYRSFEEITEEEILSLGGKVKQWVIGQDEAIDTICETIQLAKCGLKEPNTPIGSFMLSGETGCGKTWSAKMFAKELCGDETAIIRIDCSEYSQKHEISKLIGSPNGYVGYDEGSPLVSEVQKKKFCVLLFDEIEKAHTKIYDLLLQVMDEGRLTGNKGEVASFNDVLILLTSNIGVREVSQVGSRIGLGDVAVLTKDKQEKAIGEALKKKFKPEFLNRLDGVITFNRLTKEACLKIVDLQFNQLNSWLSEKGLKVEFDEEVREWVYKRGFQDGFGARPLKRTIKKEVSLPIAKMLLNEKKTSDAAIVISCKEDKLVFDVSTNKVDKPE